MLIRRTAAWTELSNDDAAQDNLQDLNAGQTHRANLALRVLDERFNVSTDLHGIGRGSDRGRGGGRGGRGGGHIGSRKGRHGPTR